MEWQNFLNLCICQESQLQRVEDYRRVSLWLGTQGGGCRGVGWWWGFKDRAGALCLSPSAGIVSRMTFSAGLLQVSLFF